MELYILTFKENIICQGFNGKFIYRLKIYLIKKHIKIVMCKIVRTQKFMLYFILFFYFYFYFFVSSQKLMWYNIMKFDNYSNY